MSFHKDLNFGEKYQRELIKILKPTKYKMMEGFFKEYDLIIDDDFFPIFYEVKADRQAYKYWQFCIEYECNKKPSGINATHADYYAYFVVFPNGLYDLYIIPVIEIRKIIQNKKFNTTKEGGDRGKTKFYIIDFSLFSMYKVI